MPTFVGDSESKYNQWGQLILSERHEHGKIAKLLRKADRIEWDRGEGKGTQHI